MKRIFLGPDDIPGIFETRKQPLLSRGKFIRRQLRYFLFSTIIFLFSILFGILGYHFTAGLSWVDSLLNASMILTGMGPVNEMDGDLAKIFSSVYALFSGIAFTTMVAVFLAPVVHRLMHSLNLDPTPEKNGNGK